MPASEFRCAFSNEPAVYSIPNPQDDSSPQTERSPVDTINSTFSRSFEGEALPIVWLKVVSADASKAADWVRTRLRACRAVSKRKIYLVEAPLRRRLELHCQKRTRRPTSICRLPPGSSCADPPDRVPKPPGPEPLKRPVSKKPFGSRN
jgi:hypothetical protein